MEQSLNFSLSTKKNSANWKFEVLSSENDHTYALVYNGVGNFNFKKIRQNKHKYQIIDIVIREETNMRKWWNFHSDKSSKSDHHKQILSYSLLLTEFVRKRVDEKPLHTNHYSNWKNIKLTLLLLNLVSRVLLRENILKHVANILPRFRNWRGNRTTMYLRYLISIGNDNFLKLYHISLQLERVDIFYFCYEMRTGPISITFCVGIQMIWSAYVAHFI